MGKRLENVAATACMTTLLMLFNFVFLSSGILMLFIGIAMRLQLRDYVDSNTEGSGAALLALAFLGAIVVIAAILACCCTARGHPALLYLYGAFLAAIALLELGAGASVYSYRSTLTEGFDQGLNFSLDAYTDTNPRTTHVDFMQSTLQCCGNKAYTDWYNLKHPQAVPLSCCKVPSEECLTNDTNKIYTQGCYNRVIELISNNVGIVAASAIAFAFFPLIGVLLACCLANNINKAKYEQVA
ncbi:tetraspanin-7-like [Leptopilina boulardi]|uniref:tetraspanin-7-like n=1 Tax=Leptopilina boulardi TaxID=63433 RepID=UPI0021F55B89|nr:tetraspanin-7-like [Leptopilina boulardi]